MYDLGLPTDVTPMDVPTETEREITFQSCLNMAERTFGPRDTRWDITLRLVQRRSPRRAPETFPYGQGRVKVRLYTDTVWEGFILEAAHEAVHCLNPGNGATSYLEEGVATTFSLAVVDGSLGRPEPDSSRVSKDYQDALNRASAINPNIIALGRQLRERVGSLRAVTPAVILERSPGTPFEVAQAALQAFPRQ